MPGIEIRDQVADCAKSAVMSYHQDDRTIDLECTLFPCGLALARIPITRFHRSSDWNVYHFLSGTAVVADYRAPRAKALAFLFTLDALSREYNFSWWDRVCDIHLSLDLNRRAKDFKSQLSGLVRRYRK